MAGPKGAQMPTRTSRLQQVGWTPTVANLAVILVLEIAAYCALRWAFRTAHGG